MKKIISFFAALTVLTVCTLMLSAAEYNNEIKGDIRSPIYMLVSLDDGTEIFNRAGKQKTAPAAFVKIISAITVLEKCQDLDSKVTVTASALRNTLSAPTVSAELKEGEVLSVKQLLYCSMLKSANDAADVLAEYVGGSVTGFVAMMNETVKKIGCKDTVLVNATGFDASGQYTTAHDMAEIIRYGLKLPVFKEIYCAKKVSIPATDKHEKRDYETGNRMMTAAVRDYFYEYVTGGKSGATDEAGNVVSAIAEKDGYSYLAVVMKGGTCNVGTPEERVERNAAVLDAKVMFKWAFSNIRFKVIASVDQIISVVDVVAGKSSDCVRLVPENEVSALVPASTDTKAVLIEAVEGTVSEHLTAPVRKGEKLGEARILYAGKEISRVNLVAYEDVGLSIPRYIGYNVKRILTSKAFIVVFCILLTLAAAYAGLTVAVNVRDKKANRLKIVDKKK